MTSKTSDYRETGAGSDGEARWARNLIELSEEFVQLQNQLAQLEEQAQVVADCDWTVTREQAWLAEVDPIRDRMFEIAFEVVNIPARTIAGLHVKARVLLDLVDSDRNDTTHQLAASLSRDVLELEDD